MLEAKNVPYAGFAQYYDLLGWSEFSDLIFPMIMKFFSRLNRPTENFLDLACGTGVLAGMLAKKKINVTGIDISPQMISQARAKNPSGPFQPEFAIADITDFDLQKKFDMAGCFFDSINHLRSKSEVKKTFACASKHILKKGWFLFDIVTKSGLENWKDFYHSRKDLYYVCQEARFIPAKNRARVKIEAFINDKPNGTIHVKEVFDEIYIPLDTIYDYLIQAGFAKIVIEPFSPAENIDEAERVMIYAGK